MKNDINLITQREKPRRTYDKVFLATFFLFGLVFLLALLLIICSLALKAQAGSLSRSVGEARNRIASMAAVKQKALIVSERLSTARNIISKRNNLETRTSQILALLPDNFNISSIVGEKDVVTVTVGSSDLITFDKLFEVNLNAIARDKNLGLKKIESLGFTRSGSAYELAIGFYFSEAKKN